MAKKHATSKRLKEKAVPVTRELKVQLSEIEVFFLKNNLDKSPEWLAEKLETHVDTANRYIEVIKATDVAKPLETKPGIYVATEASTMHADEARKNKTGKSFIDRNPDSCFKIRPNEPAK